MFALGKWLLRWSPAIGRPRSAFSSPTLSGRHQRAQTRIALSPGCEDLAGWIYPTVHSDQCVCHVILSGFCFVVFSPPISQPITTSKILLFKTRFLCSFTSKVLTSEQEKFDSVLSLLIHKLNYGSDSVSQLSRPYCIIKLGPLTVPVPFWIFKSVAVMRSTKPS